MLHPSLLTLTLSPSVVALRGCRHSSEVTTLVPLDAPSQSDVFLRWELRRRW
jgi:hypothetical protein